MPGFDRTGPMGRGPRTGGGFGPCSDASNDPVARGDRELRGAGRGGRPRGGGRGRCFGGGRNGFRADDTGQRYEAEDLPPSEANLLAVINRLTREVEELRARLEKLEPAR